MKRLGKFLSIVLLMSLVLAACAPAEAEPTPVVPAPEEPAPPPEPAPVEPEPVEPAPVEPEPAPAEPEPVEPEPTGEVVFFSTQFVPVEEAERFRAILQEGGFNFIGTEEGPVLDVILAGERTGQGEIDVLGALHGTFPPLQEENALMNVVDVADDLSADRELVASFLETGLLGTQDYLYYIPWMQATYVMAAHVDALEYLPAGVELDNMTWQQFGEWCQALLDETGEPRCGLPHAGLFHRFLQGYLWPSFTGGMVSEFRSAEAEEMLAWARDSLWPTIHPQSISYAFMQEPLLSGEVWVAFDHTARLIEAFNAQPDDFVAFMAPSGPAGRGFMPVIVGLAIPNAAPNPQGAEALIEYLTRPDVQGRVLRDMAFFPVVTGVDTAGLPPGVAIELEAVEAQANHPDSFPALLPVGLGERGGEINQIFRNAFDRVVLNGEDITTVLQQEGENMQNLMNETGAPCWAPDPPSAGPCPVN
jgi:multiple sugar transport system substrate-binding protein